MFSTFVAEYLHALDPVHDLPGNSLDREVVTTLVGGEKSRIVGGSPPFSERMKVRGISTSFRRVIHDFSR